MIAISAGGPAEGASDEACALFERARALRATAAPLALLERRFASN